jgi:hypothetical protein
MDGRRTTILRNPNLAHAIPDAIQEFVERALPAR